MSKKGLSLDEKRTRILDIFHSSLEVYQLKDIEKLASKKGVVLQTVKDVLMGLVDDGLVNCEKIGTSNHYWSFPQDTYIKLIQQETKLQDQIKEITAAINELKNNISVENGKRGECDDRVDALEGIEKIKVEIGELKNSYGKWKQSGTQVIQLHSSNAKNENAEISRIVDDIHGLRSWYFKMGVNDSQLKHAFGVDEDWASW